MPDQIPSIRMDIQSTEANSFLEALSSDVLSLIIEMIYHTIPDSLRELRTVSKTLNEATIPFVYRYIEIVQKLISSPRDLALQTTWAQIHRYTRHILIKDEVDWNLAVALISGCNNILRIDWAWWGFRDGAMDFKTSGTFKTLQGLYPDAEVHLIEYPWPSKRFYDMYTATIPTANIVYISAHAIKNRERNMEPLGKVIAKSPKLRVLHLTEFRGGENWKEVKVPPILQLVLKNCYWKFTRQDVERIWDFSRLESLVVTETNCALNFLSSLPRDCLAHLKELTIQGYHGRNWGENSTPQVAHFLSVGCSLEKLDLTCQLPLLSMDSITKHTKLEILRVHDYTGFGDNADEQETCPSFSIGEMERLLEGCHRLRELSLDLDGKVCDIDGFINVVARFPRVQVVELRMQTLLKEFEENDTRCDVDFDAAKCLALRLKTAKLGLPVSSLSLRVGGYGERWGRSSKEWDAQELLGHCPRRFFKFSWTHDGVPEIESFI